MKGAKPYLKCLDSKEVNRLQEVRNWIELILSQCHNAYERTTMDINRAYQGSEAGGASHLESSFQTTPSSHPQLFS